MIFLLCFSANSSDLFKTSFDNGYEKMFKFFVNDQITVEQELWTFMPMRAEKLIDGVDAISHFSNIL